MEAIVSEIKGLNENMNTMLTSSVSIKNVTSSDLNAETVDTNLLKGLLSDCQSSDGSKFYLTFNKTRALKNLSEKFFKEVAGLFDKASTKALFPCISSALTQCKESMSGLDVELGGARVAIANLTAVTSLFRPLSTGETRNLLANKALKGFMAMGLKPSKGFLCVLAKHATPDVNLAFMKMYNAAWISQHPNPTKFLCGRVSYKK